MPRTLETPGGGIRIVSTTTTKLAQRILVSSRLIASMLPSGHMPPSSLDILMRVYVAEEEATYLSVQSLSVDIRATIAVTHRWVIALETEGLLECRNDLVALTTKGYGLVVDILESLYDSQRRLD